MREWSPKIALEVSLELVKRLERLGLVDIMRIILKIKFNFR